MASLHLEVFEVGDHVADAPMAVLTRSEQEEMRLKAYESGYAAGWEDCQNAISQDAMRLSQEVANALLHLCLTHDEARRHFLRSVEPLIIHLSTSLLPALAQDSLAPVVVEAIMPILRDGTDQTLRLRLHPSSRSAVEGLLARFPKVQLVVTEDMALGPGQVLLAMEESELHIDLEGALAQIQTAVADFFAMLNWEDSDGPVS
jgi:flagellar assembly protein FliH